MFIKKIYRKVLLKGIIIYFYEFIYFINCNFYLKKLLLNKKHYNFYLITH